MTDDRRMFPGADRPDDCVIVSPKPYGIEITVVDMGADETVVLNPTTVRELAAYLNKLADETESKVK